MSEVIKRLLPATFRLIPFLLSASTLNSGRKIITHEYPNETRRYNEDLGGKLLKFSVTAIIAQPAYFEKRLLLINALNEKGSGILTHPFYGIINVSVPNFYIREMNSEIGRAVFDIEFEQTATNIFPLFGLQNISGISDIVSKVLQDTLSEVSSRYIIKPHTAKTTISKQEELHSILTSPLPAHFGLEKDRVDEFNEEQSYFIDDRFNAAQDSEKLATNIESLFKSFDAISNDFQYRYLLYSKIFDEYASNDKDILASTAQLEERRFNRKLYNSYVKTLSLVQLFLNAVKFEYKDINDLTLIIDDLTNKYEEAVSINNFTESTWSNVEEVRSKTLEYLAQLNVNKIVKTNILRGTISTILYKYYGNFDNLQELIKLNSISNPSIIKGNLNIIAVEEGK